MNYFKQLKNYITGNLEDKKRELSDILTQTFKKMEEENVPRITFYLNEIDNLDLSKDRSQDILVEYYSKSMLSGEELNLIAQTKSYETLSLVLANVPFSKDKNPKGVEILKRIYGVSLLPNHPFEYRTKGEYCTDVEEFISIISKTDFLKHVSIKDIKEMVNFEFDEYSSRQFQYKKNPLF